MTLSPRLLLVALACLLAGGTPAGRAQQPSARVSPQETVSAEVDGAKVTLVYSRPYSKDPKTGETRKIWGGLVPFGKVWRTGANEATLLTTTAPVELGGTATLPAGTYSLFTLPAEDGTAKLIVNRQTGQWGTKYDEKQDLARVDLKRDTLAKPVEQFTMTIEKAPAGGNGGVLRMLWETTEFSVPFTVRK